jgi:hypothetical protein
MNALLHGSAYLGTVVGISIVSELEGEMVGNLPGDGKSMMTQLSSEAQAHRA